MYEGLGLGRDAGAVYGLMLGEGVTHHAEIATRLGLTAGQVGDALERLVAAGLLRPSVRRRPEPATGQSVAPPDALPTEAPAARKTEPAACAGQAEPGPLCLADPSEGLRALLARQEARLLAQQAEFDRTRTTVTRLLTEYAIAEPGIRQRDTERLIGQDTVVARIEQLARGNLFETISFQTRTSGAVATTNALGLNLDGLARGIRMRSVYPDSVRRHEPSLAYARVLTAHGAEIRTVPATPLRRMLVFDRAAAIVPATLDPDCLDAVLVTAPGVVAALRALFEAVWETAEPLVAADGAAGAAGGEAGPGSRGDELTRHERGLLDLLSQGLTDEAVANRLALSVRTVRRNTAALMARLGARSRFEAGLRAKERGWL
ncbi:LuxR C-terminal-related transcriptional regulator [Streptomyces sp. SP17BM10]|uniref:helix-turn-helix transcriptional regulator n=1 Tax=Streptomyces sp. SP17BM10 TaxID=3002530 RepID=UPI002E7A4B75|nr:LuxR C-terminal-related transcriptional regulator [Streptomyces sp. SP17BM10]MEE1788345.1 LuxR C-terminal-related transcriptional regulator [Streptomyces sp. SP17BM10]